ncbi:hypothetical protein [Anabaena subtropica]|uniref:Uncharacterized protein n=1 Tax=Anabaena subtropica FACHB-260 TaxID=2692884 RepID=A0ABR8CW96_9NOST|nr:hypothetical protein [Anabaena subtropica]MBD2346080.1 hypothetical protein [Anabaena subtropica FACHB-260]
MKPVNMLNLRLTGAMAGALSLVLYPAIVHAEMQDNPEFSQDLENPSSIKSYGVHTSPSKVITEGVVGSKRWWKIQSEYTRKQ